MIKCFLCFMSIIKLTISIESLSPSINFYRNIPHIPSNFITAKLGEVNYTIKPEPYCDPGQPLFLSQYLPNNSAIGQQKAKVNIPQLNALNIVSYAGYFTVNATFNSNMFFWYFPAVNSPTTAPVVLWLNGGPGGSSLVGLFTENGPVSVDDQGNLVPRNYSWNKDHHLLYIDNPVGTGYSFSSEAGYSNNETAVGKNLLSACNQFFQLFPNLQSLPFYITGESYAGKYLPALSHAIFNTPVTPPINLQGMAMGNAVVDPINQLNYADYLYQLGLVDIHGQALFKGVQDQVINCINQMNYTCAFIYYAQLFQTIIYPQNGPLYQSLTGLTSYYNYYQGSPGNPVAPELSAATSQFITSNETRLGVHVGNIYYNNLDNETLVVQHLALDVLMSIKDWLIEALNKIRVYIYVGQLDIQLAYPMVENYLRNLNFSSAAEYQVANRSIWKVDSNVAGYVKQAGNLTEIMIRSAGHLLPKDQPQWAYTMLRQLTTGENFKNL